MRDRIRRGALRAVPGLMGLRWMVVERWRGPDWLQSEDVDPESAKVLAGALGEQVHGGPFDAMTLPTDAVCSERWPKLAGTYEQELHPVIERCLAHDHPVVVNVGAAEGYYAVGFARRGSPHVVAVDPLARARRQLRAVAEANGVADRIEIRALATRRRLHRWLADGGLVVMDCEGAEYGLLDPRRCPNLARAEVLVEVHEFAVEGLTEDLGRRFAPTHTCELIPQSPRDPDDVASLDGIDREVREQGIAERRPAALVWAHFQPRAA